MRYMKKTFLSSSYTYEDTHICHKAITDDCRQCKMRCDNKKKRQKTKLNVPDVYLVDCECLNTLILTIICSISDGINFKTHNDVNAYRMRTANIRQIVTTLKTFDEHTCKHKTYYTDGNTITVALAQRF